MEEVREPSLSHQEESCLKTALAFIVLRRRVAQGYDADVSSGKAMDVHPKPANSLKNSFQNRKHQQEQSSRDILKPLLHGVLSHTHMYSRQKNGDNKHHNKQIPLLKQDRQNEIIQLPNRHASNIHILSMLRIAVSMALPLYDRTCMIQAKDTSYEENINEFNTKTSKNSNVNRNNQSSSDGIKFFPPVYDYTTAASLNTIEETNEKSDVRSSFKVIDGLLINIASNLTSILDVPKFSVEKSEEQVLSIIEDGLFKLMFPAITYSTSYFSHSIIGGASTISNIRLILAVCTIMHRLILVDKALSYIAARAVSRLLKKMYHGECQRPIHYSDNLPPNDDRLSYDDRSTLPPLPKLADVIVVNLLHLLEGISASQLQVLSNYEDPNHRFSANDHRLAISNSAAAIILEIQSELHELTTPIAPHNMTHFYLEESKQQTMVEKRKQEKLFLRKRNKYSFGSQSIADRRYQEVGRKSLVATDDEPLMEVLSLCPAAKMMFRLFLFDILDKLSFHAT